MPNGQRKDPLVSCYFTVEFQGTIVGAFQEVTGLGSSHEVVEYKASGEKGQYVIQKVPGRMSWNNITLKRGITDAMDLWEWRRLVEEGKMQDARKNGSVVMYDLNGQEIARWNFVNAWPCKLTGPAADAKSNNVAIEELEIVVEGYTRVK
ncbi:MAG: phage tail protein [Chloroflexia bacterium]